jgi:monoamine oxidase
MACRAGRHAALSGARARRDPADLRCGAARALAPVRAVRHRGLGQRENPGTFERNFDTRNGAQQSRFVGGTQLVAERVAAALGDRVMLSSPVRRIATDKSGGVVHCDRMTVTAKRVIVAIPPVLAGRIQYEPGLPFARDQLMQRYPQGTLTKVAAVYDTPFWRSSGLTGAVLDTGGPVSASFDDSPPERLPGRPVRLRRWRQRPEL